MSTVFRHRPVSSHASSLLHTIDSASPTRVHTERGFCASELYVLPNVFMINVLSVSCDRAAASWCLTSRSGRTWAEDQMLGLHLYHRDVGNIRRFLAPARSPEIDADALAVSYIAFDGEAAELTGLVFVYALIRRTQTPSCVRWTSMYRRLSPRLMHVVVMHAPS